MLAYFFKNIFIPCVPTQLRLCPIYKSTFKVLIIPSTILCQKLVA